MKVGIVHARAGADPDTDAHAQVVARHLAARGDTVRIAAGAAWNPTLPSVAVDVVRPFALGRAGRARAFARAVEAWAARTGCEFVYSLGRSWTHGLVRMSEGSIETRAEVSPDSVHQGEMRALVEIEARSLDRANYKLVSVPSEVVGKDAMKRNHVLPEAIRIVNPGVDLVRHAPERRASDAAGARATAGLAAQDFAVLFTSSSWQHDGLDRLLKVWPQIHAERPAARLLICGEDAAGTALRRGVESAPWKSSVRFLGAGGEPAAVLAAADLFVLPTRYDPFSRTTLAALACGLPVITTAANGASSMLEEGVTGIALYGDDIRQTLYQQLLAWTKPGRARAAGPAARTAAETRPLEAEARATADAIDEAAAARGT